MIKEEIKNTNTIEEGMDKFADLVDRGIAKARNYYNEGKEGKEVAVPMGHNKFNRASAAGVAAATTTGLSTSPAGPAQGNRTTPTTTPSKATSIWSTPIEVLSKSPAFSSNMATYDPSLAPPTKILWLLKIVEDDMDAAGIFHDKVNDMPDYDLLERFETGGEISGEQRGGGGQIPTDQRPVRCSSNAQLIEPDFPLPSPSPPPVLQLSRPPPSSSTGSGAFHGQCFPAATPSLRPWASLMSLLVVATSLS